MSHIPRSPISDRLREVERHAANARNKADAAGRRADRAIREGVEMFGRNTQGEPAVCPTCHSPNLREMYSKDDGQGNRKVMYQCPRGHHVTVVPAKVSAPTR